MKKMKILLVVLSLVLCAGVLCSCQSNEERLAELAGTWTMRGDDSAEQAQALLESLEFYEEEIALVDLNSLDDVMTVTFDTEGNYAFAWDAQGIQQCLDEFYRGAFDAIYEGRTTLNEVYDYDFSAVTKEEFFQLYADLYSVSDFDALIDVFVESSYDYESLEEPMETGTFTIKGGDLMCTITGETEAEALGYKIEGDTLTLIYVNGREVYTRGN